MLGERPRNQKEGNVPGGDAPRRGEPCAGGHAIGPQEFQEKGLGILPFQGVARAGDHRDGGLRPP